MAQQTEHLPSVHVQTHSVHRHHIFAVHIKLFAQFAQVNTIVLRAQFGADLLDRVVLMSGILFDVYSQPKREEKRGQNKRAISPAYPFHPPTYQAQGPKAAPFCRLHRSDSCHPQPPHVLHCFWFHPPHTTPSNSLWCSRTKAPSAGRTQWAAFCPGTT